MGNIVWLASYPKSGNTWVRLFLDSYLYQRSETLHLAQLQLGNRIASSRRLFDETVGLGSGVLPAQLVENLRPHVYREVSANANSPVYMKIHDAYYLTDSGEPLVPDSATRSVIYIVRNPLDVCVSWTYHSGHVDINRTVRAMNKINYVSDANKFMQPDQLPQKMLSWSQHALSWIESPLNVMVLRYEDLIQHPFIWFSKLIRFLELDWDKSRLDTAINSCQFDALKEQETQNGFHEKPMKAERFFRRGLVGEWKNVLDQSHTDSLIKHHQPIMERLGYIDHSGKLTI